ncbi:hypothetical protein GCM10028808_07050 [Spirosoma migulaei]
MIPLLIGTGKLLSPVVVKYFLDNSKGAFSNIKSEALQLFGNDLEAYLSRNENNFLYIKNILHRHEPVPFYDIYYPVKIKKITQTNVDPILIDTPYDLFLSSNFITVIGTAGSGKSTLIKHVFLSTIQEKYGIPILVELRNISSENFNLEGYVKGKIIENEIAQK